MLLLNCEFMIKSGSVFYVEHRTIYDQNWNRTFFHECNRPVLPIWLTIHLMMLEERGLKRHHIAGVASKTDSRTTTAATTTTPIVWKGVWGVTKGSTWLLDLLLLLLSICSPGINGVMYNTKCKQNSPRRHFFSLSQWSLNDWRHQTLAPTASAASESKFT